MRAASVMVAIVTGATYLRFVVVESAAVLRHPESTDFMLAAFLGQEAHWADLGVVGLLVLLEGVLSIDNALVLGLLAKRLPKQQQPRALNYGLVLAFVFRFAAIGTASY